MTETHSAHEIKSPHVYMIAAECRGLAKVGGLGDVVCDLSKALHDLDVPVAVVLPCYDVIDQPAAYLEQYNVPFGGRYWIVDVFTCELDGVPVYLLRNDDFFGGEYGEVYIPSDRRGGGPFEDDAKRFAFFSVAVLEWIDRRRMAGRPVDALHCHDWHTASLLVLLRHDAAYRSLSCQVRTLFTIHNLDYQGVRPFVAGDAPERLLSFADWFPRLYRDMCMADILYPPAAGHPPGTYNPLRAGIALADNVNTVSPTYASEITQPDDPARNFTGGRGLQTDLQYAREQGRLHAILNGLDYTVNDPERLEPPFAANMAGWATARAAHRERFVRNLPALLGGLAERLGDRFRNRAEVAARMSDYDAEVWLRRPLVVAVTRAVAQKVSILRERLDDIMPVWEALLARELSLLILGSGELQDELEAINSRPNGLFVCAFDPGFAQEMYLAGDLFLMPSDFEPCGISQMIAMRYGCLPLVHDIGGLHDTVQDMRTGFVYSGQSRAGARRALLDTLDRALKLYRTDRTRWETMQLRAMEMRFAWRTAAEEYLKLYGLARP